MKALFTRQGINFLVATEMRDVHLPGIHIHRDTLKGLLDDISTLVEDAQRDSFTQVIVHWTIDAHLAYVLKERRYVH